MDMSIESFILGKLLYVDLMEASQLATDTSTVLLHLWNLVSTVVEEGLGITVGLTSTECDTASLGCLNTLQIHKVTTIFDLVDIVPVSSHQINLTNAMLHMVTVCLSKALLDQHLGSLRTDPALINH